MLLRRAGRGIIRTAAIAGTASYVAGNVHHRQEKRWAQQDAEQRAQYEQEAADAQQQTANSAGGDDAITQIQKLGELKSQGLLTEQEFQAQKARILA